MWGLDRRRIKGEEIGLITIVGFIGYFFFGTRLERSEEYEAFLGD